MTPPARCCASSARGKPPGRRPICWLATVSNYDDANAYLQEHYIAQHNRHYARPAAAEADYHRQRPTARQLDDVFWLEEERVLSEDWVVRYKNRLLQLARQNRHWAPAQSRVRVRENEPGHIVIHYRGQSLPFREIPMASSTAKSRGRGAAPSPATPSPKPTAAAGRPHRSPAGNLPYTPLFRSFPRGTAELKNLMGRPIQKPSEKRSRVSLAWRSEEHTSELQSRGHLVCRLPLEKKNIATHNSSPNASVARLTTPTTRASTPASG